MTSISRQQLTSRLRHLTGGEGLAQHLESRRDKRLDRDTLDAVLADYRKLGNTPTAAEASVLRQVGRVLDATPLFELGNETTEALRPTSEVTSRPRSWTRTMSVPAFSSLSAPRVASGGKASGTERTWRMGESSAAACEPPALSPDGETLFVLRASKGLWALNRSTGDVRWKLDLSAQKGAGAPAVSPDGQTVIFSTGFRTSCIRAVDAATGEERWRAEVPGENRYQGAPTHFSPDGRTAYVHCTDDRLHAFDVASGREEWADPPRALAGWGKATSLPTPDGKSVLFYDSRELVRVDAGSGEVIWRHNVDEKFHGNPTLSPDGTRVYVPCKLDVHIFDVETKESKGVLRDVNDGTQTSAFESPDGRFVLFASGLALSVLDPVTCEPLQTLPYPGSEPYTSEAAFSPDGNKAYFVSPKGKYLELDLKTLEPQVRTSCSEWAAGFVLSPDGKWAYQTQRTGHMAEAVSLEAP